MESPSGMIRMAAAKAIWGKTRKTRRAAVERVQRIFVLGGMAVAMRITLRVLER
jgi:hypothetical protein